MYQRYVRAAFVPPIGICRVNAEGVPIEPCAALGSGFDMRNTDIQNPSDMKNRGKSDILTEDARSGKCIVLNTSASSLPSKWESSDTHSLIENLAASAHMGGSFDAKIVSLKASADAMTGTNVNKHSNLQTGGFNQYATSGKIQIDSDCYLDEAQLNPKMLADFKRLPMILRPEIAAAWRDYKIFIETYGTHMQQAIDVGVRINVLNSLESSAEQVAKELHIKSCLDAGYKMFGFNGCGDVNRDSKVSEEVKKATEKRFIYGGSPELQRKLSQLGVKMEPGDVDAFMKSPIDFQDGISYHMKPIWEVISSALTKSMMQRRLTGYPHHLKTVEEDQQRIINLQTFVEGVTLCPSITLGDWKVRELRATDPDTPSRTGYGCWNRHPGCRDDSACSPVGVVNLNCKCTSAGGCVNIGQNAYGIDMPVAFDGSDKRSFEGANRSCKRTSYYGEHKCTCNPDDVSAGSDYYTWTI